MPPNAWLVEVEYFITDTGVPNGTIIARFILDSAPGVEQVKTFQPFEPADIMAEIVAWAASQSIVFR